MSTFGSRLKNLRENKELSQGELGKRFNLSQSTIAYYESDKKQPNNNTLKKIADFFGVTVDYLLLGMEEKNQRGNTNNEEQILLARIRDIAERHNMDLNDPNFLKYVDIAFDIAQRVRTEESD